MTTDHTHTGARLEGRVAVVTGAARGQGRAHSLRFAAEGADVILVDSVREIDQIGYPMPGTEDLHRVAEEVEATGRRAMVIEADVRDVDNLVKGVEAAASDLGRLDVVVANAGVLGSPKPSWEMDLAEWSSVVDINLTGVWASVKAALPSMIAAGNGGSVILISSIAGLRGVPNVANYAAAKHGVVGLAGSVANEVAQYGIRVNSVHPTNVRTPMIDNPTSAKIFRPELEAPTLEDGWAVLQGINLLPVPWIESEDVSNAVLWLASDESRFVTGANIPVDAGMLAKYGG